MNNFKLFFESSESSVNSFIEYLIKESASPWSNNRYKRIENFIMLKDGEARQTYAKKHQPISSFLDNIKVFSPPNTAFRKIMDLATDNDIDAHFLQYVENISQEDMPPAIKVFESFMREFIESVVAFSDL